MSGGAGDEARLGPAEARAALAAVSWYILHAPGALTGPDGPALLAARARLADAVEGTPEPFRERA